MNASENFDPGRADALAWVANAERTRETDRLIAPYVDAAAVLSTFKLETIQPVGVGHDSQRTEALIELTNRSHPVGELGLDTWQLEDTVRRAALRRLGDCAAMRKARAANPDSSSDPLQQGIDLLIRSNELLKLDDLSLDQLLGLERAARWLDEIPAPLPSRLDLAARIERERQLAPMRKIAGEGFVDRENYLAQLADYVGTLPAETAWRGLRRGIKFVAYWLDQRPPLHLYGPGGIGKSAVLARFILDHANPQQTQPLPFVYLDFDRAALDPRDPQTILEDSVRQLLIQFPWVNKELVGLGAEVRENVARFEAVEYSKSGHFEGTENLIRRFCRLLEVIAEKNDQPVLIVLDTLEEAEYQGHTAMLVTWNLLRDLLKKVDRLRIVTAGRSALPPELPREPVELTGLSEEAAMQLVTQRTTKLPGGPVSIEDARLIISLVGTVPLSVVLAVRVVMNEGVAGLRSTVSRRQLFSRIKAEQQQGMLYHRILSHLQRHDSELEKVANPGLILRRITPDIIEQVLAQPCQLNLQDRQHAQRLFEELKNEVGLVDPYRELGALWHLPAVRRIMLPELRGTLGSIPRLIHEAAARYYHGRPSAIERAEEVYHRLWLGSDASELDELWSPDLVPHLRAAYEELEPNGKIWLGNKLGIELEEGLRRQADFSIWERQTEQRARTLMSSGLFDEALAALTERETPIRPSPLYALEADALKLLGRLEEAKLILDKGLVAAEQAGDSGAMLPLVLRQVFLHEAAGGLKEALARARYALGLAQRLREPLECLSAGVAVLRLVRKVKAEGWTEEAARKGGFLLEYRSLDSFLMKVREGMLLLLEDGKVRSVLRSRPALLQEAAAELGSDNNNLLIEAISLLGISSDDWLALIRYTQASATALDDTHRELLDELKRSETSRGMGQQVAKLVPAFSDFFVRRLSQSVEDALQRSVDRPSSGDSQGEVMHLSGPERAKLQRLVLDAFTREELQLLVKDSFDLDLGKMVRQGEALVPQVFDLLKTAETQGFLGKLVKHLSRSRPDNLELGQFVRDLET